MWHSKRKRWKIKTKDIVDTVTKSNRQIIRDPEREENRREVVFKEIVDYTSPEPKCQPKIKTLVIITVQGANGDISVILTTFN